MAALARWAQTASNQALAQSAPERRYPALLAFGAERLAEVTDELVDLFDKLLADTNAKARRRLGEYQKSVAGASQTRRVRPGEPFTFGRAPVCSAVLPAGDRGVSRHAGSLRYHGGCWWLHNDSSSAMLCMLGDRGFRADLPPGLQVPLQQWHAKVTVSGVLGIYTLRLRLPGLDDAPDPAEQAPVAAGTGEGAVTSTRYRAPLTGSDRLVLAARFEEYLTWRHAGIPAPASARDIAERIGWQAHTVAKRCENIRARYARLGVPGLGGPRALEQLALLLVSTGELTAADLQLLPAKAPPG